MGSCPLRRAFLRLGFVLGVVLLRQVIGQPEPVVGMGATILLWTDRHAATITEVFVLGKYTYVKVRQDTSKRIDKNGMSEDQDYEFTPNPR